MIIRSVLLTSKVTLYEMACKSKGDPALVRMIKERDPVVAQVESSHLETVYARGRVRGLLEKRGIKVFEAKKLRWIPNKKYDLIVALGGDGTVLDVARWVDSTPILAVNSSPSSSYGHLTCATADSLDEFLTKIIEDVVEPVELSRINILIDRGCYKHPALNDVLVCNSLPAAASRYVLGINGVEEEQKSSGIWVATAAGSTGAIRSAGGQMVSMLDGRLQFLVREPFAGALDHRYELTTGFVGDFGVTIRSRMIHGSIYMDGRRNRVPIGYGTEIKLTPDAQPLRLFIDKARMHQGA